MGVLERREEHVPDGIVVPLLPDGLREGLHEELLTDVETRALEELHGTDERRDGRALVLREVLHFEELEMVYVLLHRELARAGELVVVTAVLGDAVLLRLDVAAVQDLHDLVEGTRLVEVLHRHVLEEVLHGRFDGAVQRDRPVLHRNPVEGEPQHDLFDPALVVLGVQVILQD